MSALNLYDALNEKKELFTHFGGHHMAAGMTLPAENIDALKEQLICYIEKRAINLSKGQELLIDEVLTIEETTISFINQLKLLAPFGTDNPMPNFSYKKAAAIQVRQIGAQQNHLKLQITDSSASLDVIAFQMGKDVKEFAENHCNIVGKLSVNEWNGNKKPQLMAEDYAIEDIQLFDLRGKANQQQDIPEQNTLFVYFQKESVRFLKTSTGNKLYYESSDQFLSETNGMTIEQLVIVDCPDELAVIKQLIEGINADRIYLLGISADEAYLNGAGSREQFAKLYALIRKQETLDVRYKLGTVSNYLQIQEKLLIFMIQVFFDLGFVTIEDGVLRNVDNPENHLLTESEVYQKRLKKIKIEKFLIYSDRKALLNWLLNEEEE